MEASTDLIDLIKQHEGFSDTSYKDLNGYWTYGYGHLATKNKNAAKPLEYISESDALDLLISDVNKVSDVMNKTGLLLTQEQFDGFVDFGFGVGIGRLRHALRLLDKGDIDSMTSYILSICHVNGEENEFAKSIREREIAMINPPLLAGQTVNLAALFDLKWQLFVLPVIIGLGILYFSYEHKINTFIASKFRKFSK
jgi:lysozyme